MGPRRPRVPDAASGSCRTSSTRSSLRAASCSSRRPGTGEADPDAHRGQAHPRLYAASRPTGSRHVRAVGDGSCVRLGAVERWRTRRSFSWGLLLVLDRDAGDLPEFTDSVVSQSPHGLAVKVLHAQDVDLHGFENDQVIPPAEFGVEVLVGDRSPGERCAFQWPNRRPVWSAHVGRCRAPGIDRGRRRPLGRLHRVFAVGVRRKRASVAPADVDAGFSGWAPPLRGMSGRWATRSAILFP